jgi:hypothetical protein
LCRNSIRRSQPLLTLLALGLLLLRESGAGERGDQEGRPDERFHWAASSI